MSAWVLVLFLANGTVASVPGFAFRSDCEKAAYDMGTFAGEQKLPAFKYLCIEQPRH